MKILVTGGVGFIGSAVVRELIAHSDHQVGVVDKITYAGFEENLASVSESERYQLFKVDICDGAGVEAVFDSFQPDAIMHLAAESHVDRSIDGPAEFIQTNVIGTFTLLEATRRYMAGRPDRPFKFHHISTDEVYGDLDEGGFFTETTAYEPSSPYSASKASSDHLVRAWGRTYGLPVVVTNCSNNYGPYHHPEKLVPHIILKALRGEPLPVYGDGQQIRDWLYVEDHARALVTVLLRGELNETYNIGGNNEKTNFSVVETICGILDKKSPSQHSGIEKYDQLITFVADRPGHDVRYAIDASKIQAELEWFPEETFESGLEKTINWYLSNDEWISAVTGGEYSLHRAGLAEKG